MPYRAHGHRRGTVMRERIASLAPPVTDVLSLIGTKGAGGSLALRALSERHHQRSVEVSGAGGRCARAGRYGI